MVNSRRCSSSKAGTTTDRSRVGGSEMSGKSCCWSVSLSVNERSFGERSTTGCGVVRDLMAMQTCKVLCEYRINVGFVVLM